MKKTSASLTRRDEILIRVAMDHEDIEIAGLAGEFAASCVFDQAGVGWIDLGQRPDHHSTFLKSLTAHRPDYLVFYGGGSRGARATCSALLQLTGTTLRRRSTPQASQSRCYSGTGWPTDASSIESAFWTTCWSRTPTTKARSGSAGIFLQRSSPRPGWRPHRARKMHRRRRLLEQNKPLVACAQGGRFW